jgi:membrane-associated PAP2 superfamily phosphatase
MPRSAARQAAWRDLWLTLLGLAAVLAWDAAAADLAAMHWVGDATGFAWHSHWLAADVLHDGGGWLSRAVWLVLACNAFRPLPGLAGMARRQRLAGCLIPLAAAGLVWSIKHFSRVSCPWSLAEFGGSARHLSHWAVAAWSRPGDGGPGGCFPAGHASSAFGFFVGWFALRDRWPRAARRWLAAVWLCGVLFGLTQWVRGAHYPSHTLWTAWLCWTCSALLWHGLAGHWRRAAAGQWAGRGAHLAP